MNEISGAVTDMMRGRITRRQFVGRALALGLSVSAIGSVLASCGSGQDEGEGDVFKVGFAADLSGLMAAYDTPLLEGAKFAIEEVNADGGVAGMKLELVSKDIKGDEALAVQVAQELIDEGIQYNIGTCNAAVIAVNRLMGDNEIPCDIGEDTDPNDPGDCGEFTHSYVLTDDVQAAVMAEYAYKELGYRTVCLVKSKDDTYSNNTPLYFGQAFEHHGGKVVAALDFKTMSQDFSAIVTKIKALSPAPDCIYSVMFIPDTPVFLRQLHAANVHIPYIGGESLDMKELTSTGADALDGVIFPTFAYPERGSSLEALYQRWEEKKGSPPDTIIVANGYDTILIIKAALEQTGGEGGRALRDAINSMSGLELTTTDNFTMDQATRIAKRGAALIRMAGTEFVFVKNLDFPSFVPEPM